MRQSPTSSGSLTWPLDSWPHWIFSRGLLTDRTFLLSERLTAADCIAFPFIKYAALGVQAHDEKLFHQILVDYQPLAQHHVRLREWIACVDALPRG
jgi:glutathione S-transferase